MAYNAQSENEIWARGGEVKPAQNTVFTSERKIRRKRLRGPRETLTIVAGCGAFDCAQEHILRHGS